MSPVVAGTVDLPPRWWRVELRPPRLELRIEGGTGGVHFCTIWRPERSMVQKRTVWVLECIRAAADAFVMQKCTLAARPPATSLTQRS
jgi:hypothetical protein